MNTLQRFLLKAIGFPPWRGSTTDIPPGGWGSFDNYRPFYESGAQSAVDLAAVYGCCRILCQTIGSLPWDVYKENLKTGVREKALDHWLYPVLHDSPNAYMTSMEFREALVFGFCLRGNGYAEKVKLGDRVVGLNPLRADLVRPKWQWNQPLVYEYYDLNGNTRTFKPEDLVHVKNFSLDGILGLSPIGRHVIEHAHRTEYYASSFMQNQARPSGIVESDKPKPKDPGFLDAWMRDWKKLFSGDQAGNTGILWDGAKYKAISISPEDAQYIETRKLNTADIAAIFGVPLNMLGHSDKTATYASAEQFALDFVKHTARPLAERFEQAFNKALFATQPGFYCEMNLDGLMRGDSKTQADYFHVLCDAGIMTRNEARRKLNLPERPEADLLTVRTYEVDLKDLPRLSAAAQPGLSQTDIRKQLPENHVHVTTPMAEEQMTRVVKEITTAAAASKRKTIRLVKTADGTTTGAEVTED